MVPRLLALLLPLHNAVAPAATARVAFTASPAAVQTVYQRNVPHTDRNGRPLTAFEHARSFLPLVLYDPQLPCSNTTSTAKGQTCLPRGPNASVYAAANFTTVLPYSAYKMDRFMEGFAAAGLQVIREHPTMDEVHRYRNHPSMLAWYLEEEPTGNYWNASDPTQQKEEDRFAAYEALRQQIKAVDRVHPVFVMDGSSDGATQLAPPTNDWWRQWNTHGGVSSHDQYPFDARSLSMETFNAKFPGGHGGGLPQSVQTATRDNNESKPLWVCLQAFESAGWIMPTPRQVRGQIYAAFIHGATGVFYFQMDSIVARTGGNVGFGPAALTAVEYSGEVVPGYNGPDAHEVASPSLLAEADSLWKAVAALNSELLEIRHLLLAPTSTLPYSVSIGGLFHTSETPIRTLRKTVLGGGDYILAVNIDRGLVGARFDVPGLSQSTVVRLMFEDGRVIPARQRPSATVWVDTFEPYGVHVYILKGP